MPRTRKTSYSVLLIVSLAFSLLLVPGCWSAHELTDEFIVLALSIDKSEKGVRLTLQGIRPERSVSNTASSGSGSTSGASSEAFFLLACEGDSIQEALQGIDRVSPRFLYGGHNQVIFIGEDLAKSGIMPYMDYFARAHWSQDSTWMIIAKQGIGQELLSTANVLVKYPSMGLAEMVKKQEIHLSTLFEFLRNYHGESDSQIFASAIIHRNKAAPQGFQIEQLLLQSCAIIKKDKLEGYLTDQAGETFDWLYYGFRSSRFSFSREQGCDSPAIGLTLEGQPANIRLTQTEAGELRAKFIIKVDFSIKEGCSEPMHSPKDIALLENDVSQALSKQIQALIKELQTQKADVFNIAEKVHAYKPKVWKTVSENWPETFANLPVDIEVSSHFRHSGIIQKNPGLKE